MPRWFRWRARIWHLRAYRDRRDRWVGVFHEGMKLDYLPHGAVGWAARHTLYVCPLPTLVIKLWRYES